MKRVRFILTPIDALRIATALFFAFDLIGLLPFADLLYGGRSLEPLAPNSPLAVVSSFVSPTLFLVSALAFAVLLAFDVATRVSSAATWLFLFSMTSSGNLSHYGIHFYLTFAMMIVTLATWFPDLGSPLFSWGKLLFALTYFNAGLAKLMSEDWRTGDRLWTIFVAPELGGLNPATWASYANLIPVLAWSTILSQLFYLPWALSGRARTLLFIVTSFVHAQIALLVGLWDFSGYMIALNAIFLLGGRRDESLHRSLGFGLFEKPKQTA